MKFLDTNILLYALGTDQHATKAAIARDILGAGDVAFSIQVFQEFYVQATHSRRKDPLTHAEATELIDGLCQHSVQVNDLAVFRSALVIKDRYQTSFWDASILAAAQTLGCEIVLSEDLNHGQQYDRVTVRNPFIEC